MSARCFGGVWAGKFIKAGLAAQHAHIDIILNSPCLFSDLSTGRQLGWRRVCPSKGYSYSSRLLQTSSSGLSVLLIFRSSLSLPHRCISLCFISRDHPQLFNCLCVVILMFWPVTTDCVFTRSTVFSSVSLFMEYFIWQWFTIVVSGKIIKYRGYSKVKYSKIFFFWKKYFFWGEIQIYSNRIFFKNNTLQYYCFNICLFF